MTMMGLLTGIFIVVVVPLALAEGTEVAPWLALRIVRRAALQLPAEHQDGYLEEWRGNLEDTPGKLTKLAHALGMWCWAWASRRALRRGERVARYAVASMRVGLVGRALTWSGGGFLLVFTVMPVLLYLLAMLFPGFESAIISLNGTLNWVPVEAGIMIVFVSSVVLFLCLLLAVVALLVGMLLRLVHAVAEYAIWTWIWMRQERNLVRVLRRLRDAVFEDGLPAASSVQFPDASDTGRQR